MFHINFMAPHQEILSIEKKQQIFTYHEISSTHHTVNFENPKILNRAATVQNNFRPANLTLHH